MGFVRAMCVAALYGVWGLTVWCGRQHAAWTDVSREREGWWTR